MGQSTNAILFYGYAWEEEESKPWNIGKEFEGEGYDDSDEDWEERYARLRGLAPPSRPFPPREVPRTRENGFSSTPTDYTAEEQSIIDEYRAFWKAKGELVETEPCAVDSHCSGDCPMPYVAIKDSVTTAHRGSVEHITSLDVGPTWEADLRAFCERMGIDVGDQAPGWHLVSMWS